MMNWKTLTLAAAGVVVGWSLPAGAQEKVDFAKQVEPLLAKTCFSCHGEKEKGGLMLNTLEAIKTGGDSGSAIVPGDPEKSEVYKRIILPEDHDDIMPPKGDPLTKEQQALVGQWIKEGANFGDWKASPAKAGEAGTPAAGGAAASGGAAAPVAEIPLPQVAAADGSAVEKLGGAGGRAMPLAQGTNLLAVTFSSAAEQTDDAKLALLAPVSAQVFELNLANTKVTDAGLAPLAGLTNLRRLHLEKTGVGDEGLKHLKDLKGLEYLNLYGTKVTDAGLEHLKGLTNLRKLYLWQSQVTEAGAAKLKESLPQVTLDLGWKEPVKDAEKKDDEKKTEQAKAEQEKKS